MSFPLTCLSVCLMTAFGAETQTSSAPVASLTIRADWFDRGNVRVSLPGQSYADKFACIWNAGNLPNQSEYDIDFPVTAEYTFQALYTAASSRPVEILLDGKKLHTGFAGVTGSWQTSSARWERQCTAKITAGKHTIQLLCPGPCMPHICAFRLDSPVPFPSGWTLDRPAARKNLEPVEMPLPTGHLIPEIPLLAHLDDGLKMEVMRSEQLESVGTATTNELLMKAPALAVAGLTTPWVARLSLTGADGKTQHEALNLSPSRLREMIDRTTGMISDFRTMEGVAGDFLESAHQRCQRLVTELEAVLEGADEQSQWERFASLYLDAVRLQRRVACRNPLIDFDRLLLVKRSASSPRLGLPQNWQSNCVLPVQGFDDEIAVLSLVDAGRPLTTLYRPEGAHFVGDVDLHFDGTKLLFSSIGERDKWHVFEIQADGSALRQITPSLPDVHHYDACYLPDGAIIFSSTAFMAAVPCVNGSTRVANFYRLESDGTIRQLCFDQEHNWCPTVMESGRVLYLRWEYTDTPHSHDRVLFTMNPDGTEQMEFYGSNSYWPNSLFYARPIPSNPGMFVGIVGGHHGVPRMGELVLFDVRQGRREADGAIQRIPGSGKPVKSALDPRYESTLIKDNLADASWPKFLHPYPLSEKYFLVACQPTSRSLWGIYLVDTFDNMTLIKEVPGYALLEPIPLRPSHRPPVIPPKVDLRRTDAVVHLADIYAGDGLKGIPRGTVKRLRLFSYHYLYPGMGGPQGVVGMEGPWDIKRIVGTVPVEADGSATFRIPANTPISVQPLDAEGKALQLMRSWFTGMPGEVISCVGCHESQNSSPPVKLAKAALQEPAEIEPWYGPPRGFNFEREVQPVLDRYCVGCHHGRPVEEEEEGLTAFDLRGLEQITDYTSVYHFGGDDAGHFSTSYVALHRFVRRPGLESDYHMLMPMEFHADTTQLVQMLSQGHYGVKLDGEAWDRLITWIDLNAPYHGTWTEIAGADRVRPLAQRRRELLKLYANMDSDPESEAVTAARPSSQPIVPKAAPRRDPPRVDCPGWPMEAEEAAHRQQSQGAHAWTLKLDDDVAMEMVLIPAGEFVMGSNEGNADEWPRTRVRIHKPFWMGTIEVTNQQFRLFDRAHDSRVEARFAMQFGVRGFYVNRPEQPVVRISWEHAMEFCEWLSRRTGRRFSLPTEAQWEYACRAGTDTPFSYGDEETDFSKYANLADRTLSEFVCHPYKKERTPYPNPSKYDDWIPKDVRFDDGGFLSEKGGAYKPNAWGLLDMHGNVTEWTRSAFVPYPYHDDDGRNERSSAASRVVRGGSWRDRPHRARSAFRLGYRSYQPVYNVGFRVVCEIKDGNRL
ncbi:MAG: SUMF1/EgtB/PvdO family nonheme iron enzyme [Pirellulaceae bacterium]